MAIVLPSKKIQALIIIVISIFIAYFISTLNIRSWFQSLAANAGKAVYNSSLGYSEGASIDEIDSDSDGLKDWQEELWGTDKNNTDTDNDGTKDKVEIENGRDPKIKGPDDSLEKTRGISAASVTSFSNTISSDPDNLSESLSHDLFLKFMALQTSGNLNEETQNELINNVISGVNPGNIPPQYTVEDVIISDNTNNAFKLYGNSVAAILKGIEDKGGRNSGNADVLNFYNQSILKLKNIPVPGDLGFAHLQLLNNFNASYQMLILISNPKDPVKGLAAFKSFQVNIQNTVEIMEKIAAEFKNNDIIFDKAEAGYIWNNYR